MEDEADPGSIRRIVLAAMVIAVCAALSLIAAGWDPLHPGGLLQAQAQEDARAPGDGIAPPEVPSADAVRDFIGHLPLLVFLIVTSAFFSASEVAFFSIQKLRLRGLADSGSFTGRLVATMMDHPNRLLTTILIGNMIVNVLISVMMPPRVEALLYSLGLHPSASYPATVLICTMVLVFFGEITPKVFAVRVSEIFARTAALPLRGADLLLYLPRWATLRVTDFIFQITRFNDIKAAPFITDEEFKSVLGYRDVQGVIEEEDRQMIEGILDFGDATLQEILVPRPDVVALSEDASIREARDCFREREYSRIPLYAGDLDHVTGVLFAKDLLPRIMEGELDAPVKSLARPPNFVPITMTVRGFLRDAQRRRMHQAIVVDEYGGTEGIVTLEDAIEEVVGEIGEEEEEDKVLLERLGDGCYRVDASASLDDVSELIGIQMQDAEHETLAGFLMDKTGKIPDVGDRLEYQGAAFTVEGTVGKRASSIHIEVSLEQRREDAS